MGLREQHPLQAAFAGSGFAGENADAPGINEELQSRESRLG